MVEMLQTIGQILACVAMLGTIVLLALMRSTWRRGDERHSLGSDRGSDARLRYVSRPPLTPRPHGNPQHHSHQRRSDQQGPEREAKSQPLLLDDVGSSWNVPATQPPRLKPKTQNDRPH